MTIIEQIVNEASVAESSINKAVEDGKISKRVSHFLADECIRFLVGMHGNLLMSSMMKQHQEDTLIATPATGQIMVKN